LNVVDEEGRLLFHNSEACASCWATRRKNRSSFDTKRSGMTSPPEPESSSVGRARRPAAERGSDLAHQAGPA
jgi:hypothetical protein